ncbi:MAG: hypothetical protein ABWZ54_01240, partial [Luteibacter sp.]
MAMIPCRRHALALALTGVFAASVSATEYPFGILVDSGSAVTLERGDVVSVSGPAAGRAITVAARGSLEAAGVRVENRTSGNAAGYAYGLLAFDGSDASLRGGAVTTRGDRSVGVQLQGGARATLQEVDIVTGGAGSIGVTARAGSLVGLNLARLRIGGADSRGLVAQGEGATLVGRVDVDHSGVKSAQGVASAVDIRDGGDVGLSDSSILSRQP